jgi:hypothetical protein
MNSTITRLGARVSMLVCATASLAACATVTRGANQEFRVESSPPGASVTTSNGFACASTPCTFRMARKAGFTVTVAKEGYVEQTHSVESVLSGGGGAALAGNLLVGGIIGAGVDASTGALNDLRPNPLVVTLEPRP